MCHDQNQGVSGRSAKTAGFWLALSISVIFLLVTRQHAWSVPQIDWDEGTRMSIASSLNHGRTLYVDAWDHHTFLDILFFQQFFRLLPCASVPLAVRLCNGAIVLALCMLVHRGVTKASGSSAWGLGATTVCAYLFGRGWALSSYGEFYHSLPVALAFYLYLHCPRTSARFFCAGVLFGLAFFTKQTAAIDLGAFVVMVVLSRRSSEEASSRVNSAIGVLAWCLAGFLVVMLASASYFAIHGSLREAAYMIFVDPLTYSTGGSAQETVVRYGQALLQLCGAAMRVNWVVTAILVASLVLIAVRQGDQGRLSASARLAWAAFLWLFVDMAGLMLVGRFYPHYLIQLIVPASVASTFVLSSVKQGFQGVATYVLFVVLLAQSALSPAVEWPEVAQGKWDEVNEIVGFLRANTKPEEGVFLYREPMLCIYFLAERFPPTKVFMDDQFLQQNKDGPALLAEAMTSLRQHPPKFIVMGESPEWLEKTRIPEIDSFISASYEVKTNFGIHKVFTLRHGTVSFNP